MAKLQEAKYFDLHKLSILLGLNLIPLQLHHVNSYIPLQLHQVNSDIVAKPTSTAAPSLPIKRSNAAELKLKERKKSLCDHRDVKYQPGHKCKSKYLLSIGEDDDQLS